MKPFALQPSMTTLGGVFYPTGYMVLMFPTARDARAAAQRLQADGLGDDEISLVAPQQFQREIDGAMGDDQDSLPSAGTEGATARRFAELARQGHHALLVHAPSSRLSEHVMDLLRDAPISFGQRYRHLVIEDLR